MIICNPTVVLFADILWHKVASMKFIMSKLFSVLVLVVFIFGQAILVGHTRQITQTEEYVMFGCRVANYVGSLTKLIYSSWASQLLALPILSFSISKHLHALDAMLQGALASSFRFARRLNSHSDSAAFTEAS